MSLIVAGIGTAVGKTIASAIFCQALNADYWKPIQAGDLAHSDSDSVRRLVGHNANFKTWPEAYRLNHAMSPHAAASRDGVTIELPTLLAAQANKNSKETVIELAGGLMVPLSESLSTIDFVTALAHPVVLVANYYLGSINHTLLSIHLLKTLGVPMLGIVFNGSPNNESRDVILAQTGIELLGEVPQAERIDTAFIQEHAEKIRQHPAMARL